MPPTPMHCGLLGQALGLFWEHHSVWWWWGPQVLRNGRLWGPPGQRLQETFCGLSKVLVGEPKAGTYLLSTGPKCGQLVLKIKRPLWEMRARAGGQYKGRPHPAAQNAAWRQGEATGC